MILNVVVSILFFGCNESVDKPSSKIVNKPIEAIKSDTIKEIDKVNTTNLKGLVSIKSIKEKCKGLSTSTKLSKEKSTNYYLPTNNGFFGRYLLFVKHDKKINEVGYLTIHSIETTWKYDNGTDKFIELIALTDDIELKNGIKVNSTKTELLALLGKPSIEDGETLYYYNKSNDASSVIAIFQLEKDKVVKYKVGVYNSEITLENLPDLIKNF